MGILYFEIQVRFYVFADWGKVHGNYRIYFRQQYLFSRQSFRVIFSAAIFSPDLFSAQYILCKIVSVNPVDFHWALLSLGDFHCVVLSPMSLLEPRRFFIEPLWDWAQRADWRQVSMLSVQQVTLIGAVYTNKICTNFFPIIFLLNNTSPWIFNLPFFATANSY